MIILQGNYLPREQTVCLRGLDAMQVCFAYFELVKPIVQFCFCYDAGGELFIWKLHPSETNQSWKVHKSLS